MKHDPITLEIIQNSLRSISDEMFYTIAKTAMSPIIYEVLDMATAITNPHGELASSGSGIPAFVGALDKSVLTIIRKYGLDNIRDGDLFVTNDPYYGGVTHLNDVVFIKPVFAQTQLVGWTVNIAHWNDVSGKSPGSMSADATEIFQEGIRIPAVRIFEKDEPIQSLLDVIITNSRMPDFVRGDMWAQIAALRLGSKRIVELVEKYGLSTYLSAVSQYLDHGEQVAMKTIQQLPDGHYHIDEKQDDGTTLSVSIDICDTSLTIDLTRAPDQVDFPVNLSRDGAMLACQMALLGLIGDRDMANGGSFRPMTVITRPGSLYDVQAPAPCGMYFESMIRLNDILLRCLAEQISDNMPAGHFSSICATILGGKHPATGKHYSIIEPEIGGWGGSPHHDGANAMFCTMHGDTFNCPAEVAEVRYGVAVDQLALNPEDGGAGEFRGGKGIVLDYRILSNNSFLTCAYTRSVEAPWGLKGGQPGSFNRIELLRKNGESEVHTMSSEVEVNEGDVVRVITANGAGHGDPMQRETAAIERDIKNGYMSLDYAQSAYGYTPR